MHFQFGPRSKLYGKTIRNSFDRYHFIPRSEANKTEHVFVYSDVIPKESDEPDLYKEAIQEKEPNQVILRYQQEEQPVDEIVLLTTIEEDDRFIRNHPKLAANELFTLDSKARLAEYKSEEQH